MKTLEEIKQIRDIKRQELDLRVNYNANTNEKHILICRTGCHSSKSNVIMENLRKKLAEENITNVKVIQTGCFGLCAKRSYYSNKTRRYILCFS